MKCAIFGPKIAHLSCTNFFLVQTIIITFIYLLDIQIQSYEDVPLLGPKWSIYPPPPPNFFFYKIINIILIYILAPFIVQNLKKIPPSDPELWCTIFGLKMVNFPKWEFFSENLLMSLVSFIHANLRPKN